MIRRYKVCMAGPHHDENGQPCQDACQVYVREDGVAFAAVADGVGSELYADVGAKIAADHSVAYCADAYRSDMSREEKLALMERAFWLSYAATLLESELLGKSADQFDSTLCLAIYDGDDLWYGQSGDSGLVALLQSGEYLPVTRQQRNEADRVYPLCAGAALWEFGKVDAPVSAAMLMTDGVYEQVVPPLLRGEEGKINVPLAERLMNRRENGEAEISELEAAAKDFLRNIPKDVLDDDKTIVVLFDPDRPAKRLDENYYAPIDWNAIRKRAFLKLYGE